MGRFDPKDSRHLRAVGPEDSLATAEPPATLDQAFRRFAPYVAAIGLRMLGRPDEVDDLVQDVFIVAHRSLGQLRQLGAMKGWLATVAVRVATRRLRARRVWRSLGRDDDGNYEDLGATVADPADKIIVRRVYAELDRLSTPVRVAWTLRFLEGEKLEHVALLCECSLATAKRRIAVAQARLDEAFSEAPAASSAGGAAAVGNTNAAPGEVHRDD